MATSNVNITSIHRWNEQAGVASNLNRTLEHRMLLEELYEAIGIPDPKAESKAFMVATLERSDLVHVAESDWLDALCDLEFILHGSKCKLGLTPVQDIISQQIVIAANNQKLHGASTTSEGKVIKPDNFISPENQLQELLDERSA